MLFMINILHLYYIKHLNLSDSPPHKSIVGCADGDRGEDNNFPPNEILKIRGGNLKRIYQNLKLFIGR